MCSVTDHLHIFTCHGQKVFRTTFAENNSAQHSRQYNAQHISNKLNKTKWTHGISTLGLCIITSYASFQLILQSFMSRNNAFQNARFSLRYPPQYSYKENVLSIKTLSFARHPQHYGITAAQQCFATLRDNHFLFYILLFQYPWHFFGFSVN